MRGERIAMEIGGEMTIRIITYGGPRDFSEGADDEQRVEGMLEAFV